MGYHGWFRLIIVLPLERGSLLEQIAFLYGVKSGICKSEDRGWLLGRTPIRICRRWLLRCQKKEKQQLDVLAKGFPL